MQLRRKTHALFDVFVLFFLFGKCHGNHLQNDYTRLDWYGARHIGKMWNIFLLDCGFSELTKRAEEKLSCPTTLLFTMSEVIYTRGRTRQKQYVWISTVTEKSNGIDKILVYSNPQKKNISVSATAGTPEELSAGIVPDYDRYITVFDRTFKPKEGDVLWIDIVPEISIDGALILDDDNSPTVLPDYRLKRILDTQKGQVARYGIAKIGGNNE